MANTDGIPFYDLSSPEHEGGSVQTRSMVLSKKVSRESRPAEKIAEQSFYSITLLKRAKRGVNGRCTDSEKQKMLNTDKFECYLEKLWSEIPNEKKCSCVYLDSMWFSIYVDASIKKDQSRKAKVIKWVNEKKIFQRKYVFVPIVCWKHWNLLILCHFDEILKTDKPCMLLLDSLGKMGPGRLEPDIRRFVCDIFKGKESPIDAKAIPKIPLTVPKVPQQTNGEECGIFVLYFIHLFMNNMPQAFSQKSYSYFHTKNWFDSEDLDGFRKNVNAFFRRRRDE